MLKTLFFTILALSAYKVEASVTARWLTVASLALDDGKTRILFDPSWTRPEFLHWLNVKTYRSDETLVRAILRENHLERIDAVFASHSHFDHVVDAPMVSKVSGAVFYTDESSERLARAYKETTIKTIRITPHQKIRIGDFTVTPLPRKHPQILHLFDFLPGPVPKKTELSFWDYRTGDTWFYLIEHPEGTILLDQGSETNLETLKPHTQKIDVLLQGIANRKDDESVLQGYAKFFQPKIYVPLHFDNFFLTFQRGEEGDLPGVRIEEILDKLKKAYPTMKVDRPMYGKPITLLEVK